MIIYVYGTGVDPTPPTRHGHFSPPTLWEWGSLLLVCVHACMYVCMYVGG